MQCCCWIAAGVLCAAAGGEVPEDRIDAARRQIIRAVTVQQDNTHLARLAALRTLRDPNLREIFQTLVDHDQWSMQVHGVLGLSELDRTNLTPALLQRIDPRAREQAVLVVLDEEALDQEGLARLLSMNTLDPHLEARLHDEASRMGMAVDQDRLKQLLNSGDPRAAGRCAMILAAQGDRRALPTLDGFIMQWGEPRQLEAAFAAMQTLGHHPSPDGTRWVEDLLEAEARPGPRRFALLTLLTIDPQAGSQRWTKALTDARRHRERVDLALVRLMAGAPFPPGARALLGDEPLLHRIADAADSVSFETAPVPDAIEALVATGHGRSIEWLLDARRELDPILARAAMEQLIERVPTDGYADPTAMDQGVRAALALHALAPDRMRQLLARAPDDSPRQQALLLASLQIDDAALGDVGSGIRRIGLSRADALTLLLQARWNARLDNAGQNALALIMDGTRLSDPLRTQAAWLLLKHTDRHGGLMNAHGTAAGG